MSRIYAGYLASGSRGEASEGGLPDLTITVTVTDYSHLEGPPLHGLPTCPQIVGVHHLKKGHRSETNAGGLS
jgi:hypothetical protein